MIIIICLVIVVGIADLISFNTLKVIDAFGVVKNYENKNLFLRPSNYTKRRKKYDYENGRNRNIKINNAKKNLYDFKLIEKKWQIIWNCKKLLDKDFKRFNKYMENESKGEKKSDDKTGAEGFDGNGTEAELNRHRNEIEESTPSVGKKGGSNTVGCDMKEKYYILDMFPYPSSSGLHVGHILCFTITDVISKFKRMNKYCVFHPIGWDSFGLPCDRLSMKLKVDPRQIIKKNISNFKNQLIKLGFLFNWENEINTCEKKYFKWTQWIIIQMFLNNLAYKKKSYVNWSDELNCVISNDELRNEINLKNLKIKKIKLLQWYLKITKYAKRLVKDLNLINWPDKIKNMQNNWIGIKSGIIIKAKIMDSKYLINYYSDFIKKLKIPHIFYNSVYNNYSLLLLNRVYSSMLGHKKTYNFFLFENEDMSSSLNGSIVELCNKIDVVSSDENSEEINMSKLLLNQHNNILPVTKEINKSDVDQSNDNYVNIFITQNDSILENDKIIISIEHPDIHKIINGNKFLENIINEKILQDDMTRLKDDKIYFSGSVFYNPIINKYIPIYICSWILENHKNTLFFMEKEKADKMERNKKNELIYDLIANSKFSKKKYMYNLKDWLFSRQRYWGEPFPFMYKTEETNGREYFYKDEEENNKVQIKKVENGRKNDVYIDKIPVCLPKFDKSIYDVKTGEDVGSYENDNAHSVLSKFKDWIYLKNEKDDVLYKRECDIMPQWAGSSWYYLRYIDPKNEKKIFNKKKINSWLPVDLYVGGSEHAVLHLLYARFFHKFLYDLKLVNHKEPFKKLFNQGLLLNAASFYLYTDLQNRLISFENVGKLLKGGVKMDPIENVREQDEIVNELINGKSYKTEGNVVRKYLIDEKYVIEKENKYYLKNLNSIQVQPIYEKMSKSRGNIINPDDIVKKYGADCLRLHILFLGPVDQNKKWSIKGIKGTYKFLNKLYNLFIKRKEETDHSDDESKEWHGLICENCVEIQKDKKLISDFVKKKANGTKQGVKKLIKIVREKGNNNMILSDIIKKKKTDEIEKEKKIITNYYITQITSCIEKTRLNTAVSFFMKFYNVIKTWDYIPLKIFLIFIKLLYPFCPHISEEFWFYYLKKYKGREKGNKIKNVKKKEKVAKQICYFCNSRSLLFYAKWPSLFQIKNNEKSANISIRINNKHITYIKNNSESSKQNLIEQSTNMIKDSIDKEIKKGKKIVNIINVPNKLINFVII
ncbi:leucine--tRNA ligase, putative [Plasmodium chabaudi adami]|uniref:leucine--tRNA ligase n=1 Tax=Plasmodium chabaudi adami TaxID=5826 RepID=A0A1C6YDT3_PLACE|nr:leucine--tRNA ligase, putative [Plasmodium chabaudi adami]